MKGIAHLGLLIVACIGWGGCEAEDRASISTEVRALSDKVLICHVPPGNPSNVQLIEVGADALPAHVANHGDGVCAAGSGDCCPTPFGQAVCTDLQSDASNCGSCGNVCAAGATCKSGTCAAQLECPCDPVFGFNYIQAVGVYCRDVVRNGRLSVCLNGSDACILNVTGSNTPVDAAVCAACRAKFFPVTAGGITVGTCGDAP